MNVFKSQAFNTTVSIMCSAIDGINSGDVLNALMDGKHKAPEEMLTLESIAVALYTYWDGVYSKKVG